MRSGVTVAQTMRSMSSGFNRAESSALRAAVVPRLAEVSPTPAKRRVRMPVRVRIHSSDVSRLRVSANSSFGTIRAGKQLPVPVSATPTPSRWVIG
jgi:hypothetical protein